MVFIYFTNENLMCARCLTSEKKSSEYTYRQCLCIDCWYFGREERKC